MQLTNRNQNPVITGIDQAEEQRQDDGRGTADQPQLPLDFVMGIAKCRFDAAFVDGNLLHKNLNFINAEDHRFDNLRIGYGG